MIPERDSSFSNLNLSICSLLQVLECYIISIEFFIIPLLSALWIMLPAYLPNPVAALCGGGTPIDNGKNYSDGKRIFGDGKTLSRGEWQKLGLARVHFRQAPVLVLDEPSSSLDPLAEKDILESFADMTKSRIAIIVTHRFSTVRFADRILVVDKGRVVECGSHEELMARRGLYEKMFSHQAETYRWGASRSPSP